MITPSDERLLLEMLMNKETCIRLVEEIRIKANNKFRINIPPLDVEFFSKSTTAGMAYRSLPKVAFNEVIMRNESDDSFFSTIVHEVVHHVVYRRYPYAKQAHGPEFKYVMRMMGANPSRCHSYKVTGLGIMAKTVKRYEYKCVCGVTHLITTTIHNKILKSEIRRCNTCKNIVSRQQFTGKVIIKK